MKKQEAYDIFFNPDFTDFRFESVGKHGMIQKIVEFRYYRRGLWNLAFGDAMGNSWTDNVVSDNSDMRMVLQTVANTVHIFLEQYPLRKVYIEPLGSKRKALYNRIFQQKWEEIEAEFEVSGVLFLQNEKEWNEPFAPGKTYDAFVLALKNPTFE